MYNVFVKDYVLDGYAVIGYNESNNSEYWAIRHTISRKADTQTVQKLQGLLMDELVKSGFSKYLFSYEGMVFFESEEDARKVMAIFKTKGLRHVYCYALLYNPQGVCVDENYE